MAEFTALPWVFATLLALVHLFGEHLHDRALAHEDKIISFSAGVTITYVFLQLLPEYHQGLPYLGELGYLTVVAGLSSIHVAEHWAYQHEKSMKEIREDFREIHSIFLFLYYAAIGLLLHEFVETGVTDGVLFFIPVLLHTAISSFSLIELDEELLRNNAVRSLITAAVFIGTGIATFLTIGPHVFYTVLGIVTGMFLYVVLHDAMPDQDTGTPLYFVAGIVIYSILMAEIWLLV